MTRSEENRKFYLAHRDYMIARTKKWKLENPDKQKKYAKKYLPKWIAKIKKKEEIRLKEFLSSKPLLAK